MTATPLTRVHEPARANPPAARKRKGSRRPQRRDERAARVVAVVAIVVIGFFALAPVYWLVVTALTPQELAFSFPPSLIPREITFEHFQALTERPQLLRYLANSAIVASITSVLSVIVCSYMAYSFSKFRYRGRRSLMYLVLASQMFPHALLLITLYTVFSAYGMLNTYSALVLSFTSFTLPLCVWMLKGFFDQIPDSLLEAAQVDGASRIRTLHSIVLPLAVPGLIAAGLFAFIRAWNDFIFALTLAGAEKRTLPPGLTATYIGEAQARWPELMAASFVVSLPVVIAFIALQRYLVGGLAGAVKG
jgi:multiple sugar transport system permease protein